MAGACARAHGIARADLLEPVLLVELDGKHHGVRARGIPDALGVAHYTSSPQPTVPADNWDGNGWTFWQWTSSGSVQGISGRVDMDRYNGTDVRAETFHRLTANVTGQGTVTSSPAGVSCPSACQLNFDPGADVALAPSPGQGQQLGSWSGDCSGTGACSLAMNADRTVGAAFQNATPSARMSAAVQPDLRYARLTFSEPVRTVTAQNVLLRRDGSAVATGDPACADAGGSRIDCGAGVTGVTLTPTAPLTPGARYTVSINPPGAPSEVTDSDGTAVPAGASLTFRASTTQRETSLAAKYRWIKVADAAAHGRRMWVTHLAGGTATYAFTGPSVSWMTMTGPDQGKATVLIDGASKGTFDNYTSSRNTRRERPYRNLGEGPHTITVRALGTRASKATDARVTIDGFLVGSTWVEDPTSMRWRHAPISAARDGGVFSSDGREDVSFTFAGTGIDWQTIRGPDQGNAAVYIDGEKTMTIDNYFPSVRTRAVPFRKLSNGPHTMRIVPIGTKNSRSSRALIAIDGWRVY